MENLAAKKVNIYYSDVHDRALGVMKFLLLAIIETDTLKKVFMLTLVQKNSKILSLFINQPQPEPFGKILSIKQ